MSHVDGTHFQTLQSLETGLRRRPVVDDVVQNRSAFVLQQIATEQRAVGCQYGYGALGVSVNVKDFGVEALFGEIFSLIDIQIGAESLRLAKPEEE